MSQENPSRPEKTAQDDAGLADAGYDDVEEAIRRRTAQAVHSSDSTFQVRMVSLDLREAVAASKLGQFRNMTEIIDCVKDAIREAEHREYHPT